MLETPREGAACTSAHLSPKSWLEVAFRNARLFGVLVVELISTDDPDETGLKAGVLESLGPCHTFRRHVGLVEGTNYLQAKRQESKPLFSSRLNIEIPDSLRRKSCRGIPVNQKIRHGTMNLAASGGEGATSKRKKRKAAGKRVDKGKY